MTPFRIVIPARLQSTRLPDKVLADVGGLPLIAHVVAAARESGAEEVIVATDHERVVDACRAIDVAVEITSPDHACGTDRIWEVADRLGWDDDAIVVNLQGDEPLMPPPLLRLAADLLEQDPGAGIATLCHAIDEVEDWLNPNVVKVVCDARGRAHYFSRAPIPWERDTASLPPRQLPRAGAMRHVGLYAYRVRVLKAFQRMAPAPTEQTESLEQLRALYHGVPIRVGTVEEAPPRGVDTADDLDWVRRQLGASSAA